MNSHETKGHFFWYKNDVHLQKLVQETTTLNRAYDTPEYKNTPDGSEIFHEGSWYPLKIVGKHNLENLHAAQLVCAELGISGREFYVAISNFTGAGKRMEKIFDKNGHVVYRDFAHSPSKLKATTDAIKESHNGTLLAVFELHTFSSLTREFIPLYKNAMDAADYAIVFYNDAVFGHKKMEYIESSFVKKCFGDVSIINSKIELEKIVNRSFENGDNILLMSSGTFQKASFHFD
jgi:UDP-N-acetylmuramate: L-alanyl-gamma-D-glutamyl-meso-diaminopimelate ligase